MEKMCSSGSESEGDGMRRGAAGVAGGGECTRESSVHFPDALLVSSGRDVTGLTKMADPTDEELRRSARRQLGKWAKIMCQIVGLERVAEELMGRRTWTSYQEVMLGQDTKSGEPFCPSSIRPTHLPASRDGSRSPMAGGWYIRPASPEPQPLDLSSKPSKPPASPNRTIFKAKPRLSAVGGRRSYTEDELQKALRDIQSGKLGTRRAAVIYGIPRSTLRNKVYKISQETRDFPGLEERPDDDDEDDERDLSGAEEERETEQLLNRPLSMDDIIRLTSEVRAWPCLQQLLGGGTGGGASTSAADEPLRVPALRQPKNGEETNPILPNKDQPLDFRRDLRVHNNNNNNNHLEEKKVSPGSVGSGSTNASSSNKSQQGGKGTRPKRGKYRNYDRDSLVEAVRAVQRGEMSVHRAGSYYGVPHSTLEYKVKERHLMRPRKREPKPQPSMTSVVPEDKRKEDDKRTQPPRTPQLTPPLTNGLKMPIFDPALAYRQPYPYWQAPFALPLEFGRPELFTASQQLVARRLAAPPEENTLPLTKTTREIAESLLESSTENSSFLDGIIRSSLDTGVPNRETGGKVLLEQLCRTGQIPSEKPSESPPPTSAPTDRTPSPNSNNNNNNNSSNNNNNNNNNNNDNNSNDNNC